MKKGKTMKTWSKTILSVYKYLEALSKSLDNLILKKSVNSMFYHNGRGGGTYELANEILLLTERRINLINLKVIIENALERLALNERKLLMLFFVDNVRTDKIAELMGCCDRTFFRKKNEAVNSFSKAIIANGITKEKLNEMFGKEKWLMDLYKKNHTTDGIRSLKPSEPNYNFLKQVMRDLSNVSMKSGYLC